MGWYVALAVAVLALPFMLSEYSVGETSWVFIYGICGVALMTLVSATPDWCRWAVRRLPRHRRLSPTPISSSAGVPWIGSVALAVIITTACGFVARPAGAAHDRHLSQGDRDALLRRHHPGGVLPLRIGDNTALPACRSASPVIFGFSFADAPCAPGHAPS